MKRILTFWLLSAFIALGANLPIGNVSVRTNGVLVWPTNFFSTNRLLIQAVITNTGSGTGTNTSLTNLVDVRVNTPGLADGNVLKWIAAHGYWTNATDEGGVSGFQPASANLTNWSGLGTNQVVWTNALLALTNQLAHTNLAKFYSTNGIMVTNTDGTITVTRSGNGNQMIYTVAINPGGGGILNQPASENLTNWSNVTTNQVVWTNALVGLTNGFVTWPTTNTLVSTSSLPTLTNGFITWGTTNTLLPTNYLPTLFAMTNPLANTNGNFVFSGPVFSSASSTNSPAYNEFVVADWVRTLLSSGFHLYATTNIDAIATSGNGATNVYQFSVDIPDRISLNITNPAVDEYVMVVISTNRVSTLAGPIDMSIYLNVAGAGIPSFTVHPEIYYTYDKTNLYGDFECAGQSVANTATNLYQFVITFPTVTATNVEGFYIVGKLKVTAKAAGTPILVLSLGTNTPSHMSYASAGVSGDYVTWGTTNTLVATNALASLTNGFVTWQTTNTLAPTNVNSASINGLVKRGAGQNSKVWKTDIDGLPDWRTDESGAATNANIDAFTGLLSSTKIPTNTASSDGIVKTGSGQNAKVWKTDASGNPDWRDDATGAAGTSINVATNDVTVGDNTNITFWAGTNVTIQGTNRSGFTDITINSSGESSLPSFTIYQNGWQLMPHFGTTVWGKYIIYDEMQAGSATTTIGGMLQANGGGGQAAANLSSTPGGGRTNLNYFCRLGCYGTNGIGGTHYTRALFAQANVNFNLGSQNYNHEFRLDTEIANTNLLAQIGLLNSNNTSNQTKGIFWQFNPVETTNWVAVCIGTTSTKWTSSISPNLNYLHTLGFYGSTNGMVFHTNGVAAWTNSDSTTLDTGATYYGALVTNCKTNDNGGAASLLLIDWWKLYEY